ncbi:hypothetical protein L227DRAFT_431882 [Lentinus tigrinus ALCF2SS1-6]|uniref:Uncharacterized protein n=1 Tax=Lentinus tigrinus ALCF2SS1-6 TaxID=1328759 RepID=A0A5C2SH80_9APHY|nr:hypothetical protein L227DRAFT_431882 [Lentinus tigrinus ALCF2SS1-6]
MGAVSRDLGATSRPPTYTALPRIPRLATSFRQSVGRFDKTKLSHKAHREGRHLCGVLPGDAIPSDLQMKRLRSILHPNIQRLSRHRVEAAGMFLSVCSGARDAHFVHVVPPPEADRCPCQGLKISSPLCSDPVKQGDEQVNRIPACASFVGWTSRRECSLLLSLGRRWYHAFGPHGSYPARSVPLGACRRCGLPQGC